MYEDRIKCMKNVWIQNEKNYMINEWRQNKNVWRPNKMFEHRIKCMKNVWILTGPSLLTF